MLVALLLAGALLAALPALAGGLSLVREQVEGPLAVLEPGSATPSDSAPQGRSTTDAAPDPGAHQPADDPGPPAFSDPGTNDDGRSGGGDNGDRDDDSSGSDGGGSSGPG